MSTRDFDLNLLKVLMALIQEKNTSRAAEILDTSQPSVSRALAKLRQQLNDPLFFRDKNGLKLSPKAEKLAETLPGIYQTLLDTFEESVFQPENYNGKLKIAMNAYISDIYGAKIFMRLKQSMPKVTIELLSWTERSSKHISEEQIDIAVTFLPMLLPKGIYEKYVSTLTFGFIGNRETYQTIPSLDFKQAVMNHPICTVLIPEYNSQSLRYEQETKTKLDNLNILLKGHTIKPILDLAKQTGALFLAPRELYELNDKTQFHYMAIDNVDRQISTANIGILYNQKNRTSPIFKWVEQEITACLCTNS